MASVSYTHLDVYKRQTLVYTAQVDVGVTSFVVTPTTGQPADGTGVVVAANGGAPAALSLIHI